MAEKEAAAAPGPAGASKGPIFLALSNTIVVLAGLGFLTYTKILYHRPSITEESERARLEALQASPPPEIVPGFLTFDPVTVNIAPIPSQPKPADNTSRQLQGKLHYASIGFALELRDMNKKDDLENIRPLLMDRFLAMVGKKDFQELVTVNGRYLLRSELLDVANQLIFSRLNKGKSDPWVTNIYFTQFLVQ